LHLEPVANEQPDFPEYDFKSFRFIRGNIAYDSKELSAIRTALTSNNYLLKCLRNEPTAIIGLS